VIRSQVRKVIVEVMSKLSVRAEQKGALRRSLARSGWKEGGKIGENECFRSNGGDRSDG
jgi:hypothetical protein